MRAFVFSEWRGFGLPACDLLRLARCAGEKFRLVPNLASRIFCRDCLECLKPSMLPARSARLKPVLGFVERSSSIQNCSRASRADVSSTNSRTEKSNASSPCLSHEAWSSRDGWRPARSRYLCCVHRLDRRTAEPTYTLLEFRFLMAYMPDRASVISSMARSLRTVVARVRGARQRLSGPLIIS